MDRVSTERLWLTQPRRMTALATVIRTRGDRFALDRSLFAPTSHTHRHPQPQDTGTVWIEGGEKRRLVKSFVQDGILWHRLRGTVPPVGAKLQCQLDQDRRLLESRAHTAMHLLLAAIQQSDGPALLGDPLVKGGGTFRLDLAVPFISPPTVAAWLVQANHWVGQNRVVSVEHLARGHESRMLDIQRFQPPDPYPGPVDVMDAVRIDGVCCYPCDGTHVERTAKIGRVVVQMAKPTSAGFVVMGAVQRSV